MICVHGPYSCCERTYMAVTLANMAKQLGHRVAYVASGKQHVGVDAYWDHHILSKKVLLDQEFVDRFDVAIWMSPSGAGLANITESGVMCQHILVLDGCTPRYSNLFSGYYDIAILPSKSLPGESPVSQGFHAIMLDWGCCLPIVAPRARPRGDLRVYVPIDGNTVKKLGKCVLGSLGDLLERHGYVNLTIACNGRWSRSSLRSLELLRRDHPRRVTVVRRPSMQSQYAACVTSDWVYYPHGHGDVLWPVLLAGYAGTPVVTFRTPQAERYVENRHNGYLIDVGIEINERTSYCEARPTSLQLLEGLSASIADEELLARVTDHRWPEVARRDDVFKEFFTSLWDFYCK